MSGGRVLTGNQRTGIDVVPDMTRTHSRHRAIGLAAAAAIVIAACGSDDSGPVADPEPPPSTTMAPAPEPTDPAAELTAELAFREFVVTSVEGYPTTDDLADIPIRISFDDGSLSMHAGCNTMFGEFAFVEGRLTVEALGSTEMACETPLMARDRWLSDLVSLGLSVDLDGDVLVLSGVAGSRLELLDRTVAEPDLPLEEVRWLLDGIRDADAVSSVPEGVVASITFVDGRAMVEAGCNRGSADVEFDDDTITLSPMALTRMMCEASAMEVEATMAAILDGTVAYSITADRLSIDTIEPDDTVASDDTPDEMGGRGLLFVADPSELDDA